MSNTSVELRLKKKDREQHVMRFTDKFSEKNDGVTSCHESKVNLYEVQKPDSHRFSWYLPKKKVHFLFYSKVNHVCNQVIDQSCGD